MLPPSAWAIVGAIADEPAAPSRTAHPAAPGRRHARATKRRGQAR